MMAFTEGLTQWGGGMVGVSVRFAPDVRVRASRRGLAPSLDIVPEQTASVTAAGNPTDPLAISAQNGWIR